jgi:hypothetical protein
MFLTLILEQKENKARGKKFEDPHAGIFSQALADIYFVVQRPVFRATAPRPRLPFAQSPP